MGVFYSNKKCVCPLKCPSIWENTNSKYLSKKIYWKHTQFFLSVPLCENTRYDKDLNMAEYGCSACKKIFPSINMAYVLTVKCIKSICAPSVGRLFRKESPLSKHIAVVFPSVPTKTPIIRHYIHFGLIIVIFSAVTKTSMVQVTQWSKVVTAIQVLFYLFRVVRTETRWKRSWRGIMNLGQMSSIQDSVNGRDIQYIATNRRGHKSAGLRILGVNCPRIWGEKESPARMEWIVKSYFWQKGGSTLYIIEIIWDVCFIFTKLASMYRMD